MGRDPTAGRSVGHPLLPIRTEKSPRVRRGSTPCLATQPPVGPSATTDNHRMGSTGCCTDRLRPPIPGGPYVRRTCDRVGTNMGEPRNNTVAKLTSLSQSMRMRAASVKAGAVAGECRGHQYMRGAYPSSATTAWLAVPGRGVSIAVGSAAVGMRIREHPWR
jgi:hypothetical protein